MWNDEVLTEEDERNLISLELQYEAENEGMNPECYDELCYEAITYAEFVGYIKEALRLHCDLLDVID